MLLIPLKMLILKSMESDQFIPAQDLDHYINILMTQTRIALPIYNFSKEFFKIAHH